MSDIFLVGCGKMGSALLRGWGQTTWGKITVIDPHDLPPSLSQIPAFSAHSLEDLIHRQEKGSPSPDVIVIATKPAHVSGVCQKLHPFLSSQTLILSIAAGISLSSLAQDLPPGQPIIRAMPNTPAAIGQGITVAVCGPTIHPTHRDLAQQIFSSTGELIWIEDEHLMNAVTALSGSGPAYVFRLIEVMTQAGIDIGLPKALATSLARQTVIGSAALAAQSPDISAADLRAAVTSPGGTTEAALTLLNDQESLQILFTRALRAATHRAQELNQ